MNKQEEINKRLFNKLFAEMPSIRKLKNPIDKANNIKFNSSIKYIYYSKKTHIWFSFCETKNKYIYFFGHHTSHITKLNNVTNSLMIDFDKKNNINEHCLGIITDNFTFYLNKNILETKYSTVNLIGFDEHIIHQFDNRIKTELDVIELGNLNDDFLENLNKIIRNTPIKHSINTTTTSNLSENTSMNLFLNSIKSGKNYEQSLNIAKIGNSKVKTWYDKGRKGIEPYNEFYKTYKKIMPKDESISRKMNIILDSMKSGKSELEALEIAKVSVSELKEWKRKGQHGEVEYLDFYEDYKKIERRNIPQSKTKSKSSELINEYIKLIKKGKTNKEAFNELNIPRFKVKNWKKQGQLGNYDYKEFYDTYLMAVNREELSKVKEFVDLINEGKTNQEAFQTIKMPKFKIKQWFNKGKNGDKDFIEFYEAYMKQYGENIKIKEVKENPKPTVKVNSEKSNQEVCKICGRTIPRKTEEKLCKRCLRKQRCANIVQDLLPAIDPEVPFKKDDLKKLGLSNMQIQDYIWTLQEYSLIKKEKNNKFSLISKEKIDKFIKDSGVEIKQDTTSTIKLTKTCATCGKTLEISKFPVSENHPDGYEDNCKSCKKLITSASYLKELLEYVNYDKEFSEEELKKHYPNPFLLQAKIWSLLENDLLIHNQETNKYRLSDKDKCEEFLTKYYKKPSKPTKPKKPVETPVKPKPITPEPVKTKKQKQMESVLDAIKSGKTRKQAAKSAGISLYKITHWYKEGRDGFSEDNIYFYKEMKKLEKQQSDKLKNNIRTVLKVLKSGGSKSKAAEEASINESEIDEWIEKGNKGIKPYDSFKRKYYKLYKKSTDYNDSSNVRKRKIFIENIGNGKQRKEAAKKASLELKLIDSWIIRGTKGEKPFDEFYEQYKIARERAKEQPSTDEKTIKTEFINLLKEGYNHGEASRKIENGEYALKIKKWYAAGKQGVKKHLKFYLKCQESKNTYKNNKEKLFTFISDGFTIKQSCEKLGLNPVIIKSEILKGKDGEKPFDELYLKIVDSKTSLIDINQMFKSPDHPHKDQMVDVLDLLLIGKSKTEALKTVNVDETTFNYWINRGKREFGPLYKEFYKIYSQIESGELIKQSKKEISKELTKELDEIEDTEANILKPLPKKIKKQLDNISKESSTGFAWVNKIGDLWTYSKRIKGINIQITDMNIYELHKKVLKKNLMWGVRDLEKAKEILSMSGNEPINTAKNPKEIIKEDNDKTSDNSNKTFNEDILSPLSPHLKTKFSKGTKTGFAWVNKIGNYFYYIRSNKNIRIKASSIEGLYEKVLENNLDWGVIDLTKAKQTLNVTEPKSTIKKEILNQKDTDILTPLPKDIEKELKKYSKGTSTGFAWVSKLGTKYSYTRVINDGEITIRETNIYELYKKVINKNLTWGVRDLEKAKQTINEKQNHITNEQPKTLSEVLNQDILDPLPKEFEESFKSTNINKTGIAWVNRIGKNWIYSRRINEKTVEIKDSDIYKLHKKVIQQNLTWGIRDYERAKITLAIKSLEKGYILEQIYNNELTKYQNNKCGFALVKKIGNQWEYMRPYNGTKITDENLFGLFDKVIDKNLFWGVTDFEKAIETLKNENNQLKETAENTLTSKQSNNATNINLTNSESGIAWVIKKDNHWMYSRLIDGNSIEIKDYNIYKLHKKVITQNLTWGITDSQKAKKTLSSKPLDGTAKYLLSPISKKLAHYVKTDTGFALVFKKGKYWEYQISNSTNKLTHENIFGLYEQAFEKNYLWGVTDAEKAYLSLSNEIIADSTNNNIFSPLPEDYVENEDKEFSSIKSNINELNENRNIFSPIPDKYKKSKGITGFAWVNKVGKKWRYLKNINGENIIIEDEKIINLYNKVMENNLLWGVTDINKAKKLINEETNNILEILPEKIKSEIDLNNETGFAWLYVNETEWEYSKVKNGINISIKHKDIYKLHDIICQNKYDWGVIDLNKALKTLSKTPKEIYDTKNTKDSTIKNKTTDAKISKNTNTKDIFAFLPKNVEKELLEVSYGTNTGFAWVIKTGYDYSYQKMVDNELLTITDSDIRKLHKKVINQNYLWGVRDLFKAKETVKKSDKKNVESSINKMSDKTVQERFTNNENKIINDDILAPLPEEYKKTIKMSISHKTGIAWVQKIGNLWVYSKNTENGYITIKDSNIFNLHKKVLKEKQVWGIIDYDKAKKILFNAQSPKEEKTSNNIKNQPTVFVTLNENIVSIEGKIKNKEVLKVLTRIYEFGDNILKMNTQKNNNETTLSIELELNDSQKSEFKDKIKDFGWEIDR